MGDDERQRACSAVVTVRRPAVVAFDVVETLFSLEPVRQALRPLGVDLDLFFTRLLRDGFALTAAGGFRPFPGVARAALAALAPDHAGEAIDDVLRAADGAGRLHDLERLGQLASVALVDAHVAPAGLVTAHGEGELAARVGRRDAARRAP